MTETRINVERLPRQICERVMKIRMGDAPMVVARRGDGFQIGYSGTVWAHAVEKTRAYVGTFDHRTELEALSMALQRAF